jgi:CheY-like chemotaxis protein
MAKILIVDDDQDIRRLLTIRLKSLGHETAFAGDAISAVNQARKEQPDLILLDVMMPAGDGFVVMERLKAMPAMKGIPAIVISALDPATQERMLSESGADAYFQKPYDHDELVAAIQRALGEQTPP